MEISIPYLQNIFLRSLETIIPAFYPSESVMLDILPNSYLIHFPETISGYVCLIFSFTKAVQQ